MAKIAIIAGSQGLGLLFDHVVKVGVKNLESLSHEVVLFPTVKMSYDDVESNYQLRANDFNNAFSDDTIDIIISLIGGNDSINILPYLDLNKIKYKKVIGFSDATTYLSFLSEYGVDCIYGPSLLAGIAQFNYLGAEYQELITKILNDEMVINLPIYDTYGFEYYDWNDLDNNGRIKNMYPYNGPLKIQGDGYVSGFTWGGCFETINKLIESDYAPKSSFLKDRIIFFESSNNNNDVDVLRSFLIKYYKFGLFNEVKAILFGRQYANSDEDVEKFGIMIQELLVEEFQLVIPIIYNLPIGHNFPQWFIPYNQQLNIDIDSQKYSINKV